MDPSPTPVLAEDARLRPADRWWLMTPIVAPAAVRDGRAPDEPRYARVARRTSDFPVMHLGGSPERDKPPLLCWSSSLFERLTGWDELAMRLPSLVATCRTAWPGGRGGAKPRRIVRALAAWARLDVTSTAERRTVNSGCGAQVRIPSERQVGSNTSVLVGAQPTER